MLRMWARFLCEIFHGAKVETIVAPYTIKTTCERGCVWYHHEH